MNPKKVYVFLLIVVLVSASLHFSPKAITYIGTLSYWNSDESTIGKFSSTTGGIGVVIANSSNTTFNGYFNSGMTNAEAKWNSALGTSFELTTGYNSALPINTWGGKLSDILAHSYDFSIYDFDSTTTGATKPLSYSSWGTFKYWPSGYYYVNKTAYYLVRTVSCVLDMNYTVNYESKTKNTCLHETGHALGWFGHSSTLGDAMYPLVSVGLNLSDDDIEHLEQIYQNGWY
jgi:predicted Zn-dependent protease